MASRLVQITWKYGKWADRKTVPEGESIEEHEHPPKIKEEDFDGWYTQETGGTKVDFASYRATENITFYAHSKNSSQGKCSVTIENNDASSTFNITLMLRGSSSEIINVPYGARISSIPKPSYPGYNFLGWYKSFDENATTYNDTYKITSDMTLYARFTPILYNVTYDMGGHGTITGPYMSTYTIGSSFSPPERDAIQHDPDVTFNGWSPESIPPGTIGDFTFTAVWDTQFFNVVFLDGDNIVASFSDCEYGQKINGSDVPIPLKEGHDFDEWRLNGVKISFPYTVTQSVNISAHWKKKEYVVTFHYRKPSDTNYFEETKTVEWKDPLPFPELQPIEGYEFIGWYTGSEQGESISNDYKVVGNMDVWAWYKGGFKVDFHPEGGEFDSIQVAYMKNSLLKTYCPTAKRTGYQFSKWVDVDGNEVDDDTPVGNNMELHAVWQEDWVEITFNGNGGIWVEQKTEDEKYDNRQSYTQKELKDIPFILDANRFEKKGFRFVGWAEDSEAEEPMEKYGVFYEDGENYLPSQTLSGDLTLYAVWEKLKLVLTFDPSGGKFGDGSEDIYVTTYVVGDGWFILDDQYLNPTRDGYYFNGWYDKSGGSPISPNGFYPSRSLDLIAKWTAIDGQPQADIPQKPENPDIPSSGDYNVISPNADAGNKFTIVGSSNPCARTSICTKWRGPSSGGLLHQQGNLVTTCNPYTIIGSPTFLYKCTKFPGEYYYKVDILPGADRTGNKAAVVGTAQRPVWNRKGYVFKGWVLKNANGESIQGQPDKVGERSYYYATQKNKHSVYINRRCAHLITTSSSGTCEGFEFYALTSMP